SDFELESNLKIYPNPFNSQITFDLGNSYENVTVLIHDITGKQLYKNSFTGNQLVINNLGNLPSGMYVATLTTENGTSITKKIVK
ncbi:MAG: T9SS type A sorting domain-containing protein, partial [Flavobacterium sp.]|nr:T9SS type A sorting domain-containing protein [Flavobacterium sp.]